jgi:uncharacterized membrane protein YccF (DUF307 family)
MSLVGGVADRLGSAESGGVVRAAAVAAVVLAVALPASAAAASPTKAEFIRSGDALCARTMVLLKPIRARAAAAKTLPTEQKWVEVASIWSAQIRIQEQFAAKFKALGVPVADAKALRFGPGLDRGVTLARAVQRGFAQRSNSLLASALPAYINFTITFNRGVRTYGFRTCGL